MRVLATHSIRKFLLHFPSRASPCATRFRTSSNTSVRGLGVVVRTPRYNKANIAFWMSITFSTMTQSVIHNSAFVCPFYFHTA